MAEKNYRAELTGVFGDPVDGNPTGVMEEAAYEAAGLNYRYLTMKVKKEDLKAAFEGAKAVGMRGFNLTMPHKITVIPYLDELSAAAKLIGAVNTVINENGRWIGENTDGKGFVTALKLSGTLLEDKIVTILGSGGAARAIGVECALAGAKKITIVNRNEKHGKELASLIDGQTDARGIYQNWTPAVKIPEDTQILVQATSVGLHPAVNEKADIDYCSLTSEMVVCDVVFNPVHPLFLAEAEKQGAKTVSGIGMLVQQGALNYELWTGEKAPVDVMYQTLKNEFQGL